MQRLDLHQGAGAAQGGQGAPEGAGLLILALLQRGRPHVLARPQEAGTQVDGQQEHVHGIVQIAPFQGGDAFFVMLTRFARRLFQCNFSHGMNSVSMRNDSSG
jgi:hypothetical protein